MTVIVGIVSYWMVHDFPDQATFLSPDDRARVIRRLKEDQQASAEHEVRPRNLGAAKYGAVKLSRADPNIAGIQDDLLLAERDGLEDLVFRSHLYGSRWRIVRLLALPSHHHQCTWIQWYYRQLALGTTVRRCRRYDRRYWLCCRQNPAERPLQHLCFSHWHYRILHAHRKPISWRQVYRHVPGSSGHLPVSSGA